MATVEQSRAAPSANQLPLQVFGHFLWGAGQRRAAHGGQKPPSLPMLLAGALCSRGVCQEWAEREGCAGVQAGWLCGKGAPEPRYLYKQLGWAGQGEGPGRSWEGMTVAAGQLGHFQMAWAAVCVRVQACV